MAESPRSPALKRLRPSAPMKGDDTFMLSPAIAFAVRRAVNLLIVAVYDAANLSRVGVRLVDVSSGAVLARLDDLTTGYIGVAGGLICQVGAGGDVRVIDTDTGAVTDAAVAPAPGDAAAAHGGQRTTPSHLFCSVPWTGQHKVLRVNTPAAGASQPQTCEILTVLGARRDNRWRPAQSPPAPVTAAAVRNKAVARGVAHFLLQWPHHRGAEGDAVASFDLATEEWRPSLLRGPLSSSGRRVRRADVSLVELNYELAMVHHNYPGGSIDTWVLTDLEKGTWSMSYSLPLASVLRGWESPAAPAPVDALWRRGQLVAIGAREYLAQPLVVMVGGKMALWVEGKGLLRVLDPSTDDASVEVAGMGRFSTVLGLCKTFIGNNGRLRINLPSQM